MSDQAATQKAFNRMVQEKIDEEREVRGEENEEIHASESNKELLVTFCGMHVGVNLRAAEVKGLNKHLKENCLSTTGVDLIVHSCCKLLGHLGVNPEYGRGVVGFPEFLQALEEEACNTEERENILAAMAVKLERQVGSRYFVTSRNAGRLFFLAPLAVHYLHKVEETKELNNLEKDVLQHFTIEIDLALMKVDGLLFDMIYADLMALLKSTSLGKKYLDMNIHYLELLQFLERISDMPRLALDPSSQVFQSEERLYNRDSGQNHRTHTNYTAVRAKLYTENCFDEHLTIPLIKAAATEMGLKLKTYKADQLPGGKFWSPSHAISEALKDLDPTNDACESILGLNDWLQKGTPNMSQRTISAMVQTMKNGTMAWLSSQPDNKKDEIVDLARRNSARTRLEEKEIKEEHRLLRKRHREAEDERCRLKRIRTEKRREELQRTEKIISIDQLDEALENVQGRTPKQREAAQLNLLKKQMQVRQPDKRVCLSDKGKKKTVEDMRKEIEEMIDNETETIRMKLTIGTCVKHVLQESESTKEYHGEITEISLNTVTIKYDGYIDLFTWSFQELLEDFHKRDLCVET